VKSLFSNRFVGSIIRHYLRYDKENPFIFVATILAFLSVATGVMVLMLAMGIMNGMQKEFEKKLFVMNYPITLLSFGTEALDDRLIEHLEDKFPELLFSPYYTTQVISKNRNFVQGTLLYGVDIKRESQINPVFKQALTNQDNNDTFSIIIGDALAVETNSFVDDKLTLYFSEQQAIGFGTMPLQKRFTINGIFKSGLKNYDKAIAYTTHEALQRLLDRPTTSYDGIHIYAKNPFTAIEQIKPELPAGVIAEGWWQQNESFFAAMELEKKALFLVLLLIILIASLNIISALVMTIMSRRSEIALMITLGASYNEVRAIFFRLGLLIGGSGIVLGTLLGLLGKWILDTFDIISVPEDVYGTNKLPINILWSDFGMIIFGACVIVILTSLYPAKKAAQTDPLMVLRNE